MARDNAGRDRKAFVKNSSDFHPELDEESTEPGVPTNSTLKQHVPGAVGNVPSSTGESARDAATGIKGAGDRISREAAETRKDLGSNAEITKDKGQRREDDEHLLERLRAEGM